MAGHAWGFDSCTALPPLAAEIMARFQSGLDLEVPSFHFRR